MRGRYVASIIAMGIFAVMAFGLYLQIRDTDVFPQRLGDMALDGFEVGEEAMRSIEQLHGFSPELKMVNAYIVNYRGVGTEARIWIAEAESHDQAIKLLQSMNREIDPQDGFTGPDTVTLPRITYPQVYHVEGFGSHHYYL